MNKGYHTSVTEYVAFIDHSPAFPESAVGARQGGVVKNEMKKSAVLKKIWADVRLECIIAPVTSFQQPYGTGSRYDDLCRQ